MYMCILCEMIAALQRSLIVTGSLTAPTYSCTLILQHCHEYCMVTYDVLNYVQVLYSLFSPPSLLLLHCWGQLHTALFTPTL